MTGPGKRYQTPLPSSWFLQRPGYRRFMAREATAIALAIYLVYLLYWLYQLGHGGDAYGEVMAAARRPAVVVLHALVFGAAMYHSITWFNLTPKIMPMYVAEEKVPDFPAAILMGYVPWAVVSAIVFWGVLR